MKTITQLLLITLGIVALLAEPASAGQVSLPNVFQANTPAVADEVNANFNAVKTAVDDNDSRITTIEASIGDESGVEWVEDGDGGALSTLSTTSLMDQVTLAAPTSGFAIATASGSIYWNITAASSGLIRLKVSTTSNDVDEAPGIQFIRFGSGLGTGIFSFPFSITKVFAVSAGNNTFYLNSWQQSGSDTAYLDDYTFTVLFVPTRY